MYGKKVIQSLVLYKKELITFVSVAYLTHVTRTYICATVVVNGISMTPAINKNSKRSIVIVDLLTPADKLKLKDIVMCHDPEEPGKYIIKRIKGFAGHFITIDGSKHAKYSHKNSYLSKFAVPDGYCWVEGDNKVKSHDSRHFGPIPLRLVIGRVWFTLWEWPFYHIDVMDKNEMLITLGGSF